VPQEGAGEEEAVAVDRVEVDMVGDLEKVVPLDMVTPL
jgi:hypothetical protein